MKGIVLAAGDGGRLLPLTKECPKVLLPMYGRPLISYPIAALVAAGITDIAVVVGDRADRIIEILPQHVPKNASLEFIPNQHYLGGNALSIYAAREFVIDEEFVLCMGDHVIERDIVRRLLNNRTVAPTLCVDSAPTMQSQTKDATRVSRDLEGRIIGIGKDLLEWDAVDTGTFLLNQAVFDVIRDLRREFGTDVEISQMVNLLIRNGIRFATCDINGMFWTDVDTMEDYEFVSQLRGGTD